MASNAWWIWITCDTVLEISTCTHASVRSIRQVQIIDHSPVSWAGFSFFGNNTGWKHLPEWQVLSKFSFQHHYKDIEHLIFLDIQHFVFGIFFSFLLQSWSQLYLPIHRHYPLQEFHLKVLYDHCYMMRWKLIFWSVKAMITLLGFQLSLFF